MKDIWRPNSHSKISITSLIHIVRQLILVPFITSTVSYVLLQYWSTNAIIHCQFSFPKLTLGKRLIELLLFLMNLAKTYSSWQYICIFIKAMLFQLSAPLLSYQRFHELSLLQHCTLCTISKEQIQYMTNLSGKNYIWVYN